MKSLRDLRIQFMPQNLRNAYFDAQICRNIVEKLEALRIGEPFRELSFFQRQQYGASRRPNVKWTEVTNTWDARKRIFVKTSVEVLAT